MYCIVDLETTGGKGNKITEIAMIKFDGERIVDEYSSLINPECSIPYFITKLTGINDEMVAYSPKFYQVAKEVTLFLEGCTFVAHNVFFDFNVLKNEYRELGYDFKADKLCTVRLARKCFPGHASYSLGKICADLDIPISDRHRAKGDADATLKLFKLILEKSDTAALANEAKPKSQIALPSKLDEDALVKAPEEAGVYYLKDEAGQILYVGKSVNIKKRLGTHFRVDLKRAKDIELKNQVAQISYEVTRNELMALILEAQEIKKHRPPYNRAMNRVKFRYALALKDNDGFLSPVVSTVLGTNCALQFRSRKVVLEVIHRLYKAVFSLDNESREFEAGLLKWQKILGPEVFNAKINDWISRYDYCIESGELIYSKDQGQLTLKIKNRELTSITVETKEGEEQLYYEIDEDPEIKRMILSKLSLGKVQKIEGERQLIDPECC